MKCGNVRKPTFSFRYPLTFKCINKLNTELERVKKKNDRKRRWKSTEMNFYIANTFSYSVTFKHHHTNNAETSLYSNYQNTTYFCSCIKQELLCHYLCLYSFRE